MKTTRIKISEYAGSLSRAKRLPSVFLTVGTLLLAAAMSPQATACTACNLSFADEVISGDRANTLIGRDLRRAMENQRHLRLDGFTDQNLVAAQLAMLDAVQADSEQPEQPRVMLAANMTPAVSTASAVTGAVRAAANVSATAVPGSPAAPQGGVFPTAEASAPAKPRPLPDYMANADFIEVLERDYALATRPYSTVPQDAPVDKRFHMKLNEGSVYIGNGVVYEGFLMDGKIPGQTIIVNEGDVVEFVVENNGDIPHGMSIHAAYTQTSKYVGSIGAGTTKSVRFRAMTPGVYMYHCAPGGHAIGMHVIGGQYGMMVVRPKPGSYRLEQELGHEPNLELFLLQHELYATGKDAIAGKPDYVLFNGRTFRYIEEPIMTRPGDYVRINFLNVGPNILSTFHIVGIIWDYVYWQGHPEAILPGGQTVTAGPSDSFVIEFRMPPDEGAYTMLSHAVGSTNRGAIGLLVVDAEADVEAHRKVLADGPQFSEMEMRGYKSEATRVIAPFGIGTHPADEPVVFGPETSEVKISIIGNSYHPKVVQVAPGTTITWTNEDAFTYLAGEYSGVHNAQTTSIPDDAEGFMTPLLTHAESHSEVLEIEGVYDYICTPHPYMKGRIIVKQPEYSLGTGPAAGTATLGVWVFPLLGLCLVVSTLALVRNRNGDA